MFARLTERFHLTRGKKAYLLGCFVVAFVSAIVTLVVMVGLEPPYTLTTERMTFVYWVAIAGAMGGGVGLYFARGWMGNLGLLGFARAIVGSVVTAVIGAIIAGTLTVPFDGTLYAPLMLVSAFIAMPWLAAVWLAGMLGAHYLMSILAEEQADGFGLEEDHSVASQLSSLSRAQLYRRS